MEKELRNLIDAAHEYFVAFPPKSGKLKKAAKLDAALDAAESVLEGHQGELIWTKISKALPPAGPPKWYLVVTMAGPYDTDPVVSMDIYQEGKFYSLGGEAKKFEDKLATHWMETPNLPDDI